MKTHEVFALIDKIVQRRENSPIEAAHEIGELAKELGDKEPFRVLYCTIAAVRAQGWAAMGSLQVERGNNILDNAAALRSLLLWDTTGEDA